jgi:hypothetical protein
MAIFVELATFPEYFRNKELNVEYKSNKGRSKSRTGMSFSSLFGSVTLSCLVILTSKGTSAQLEVIATCSQIKRMFGGCKGHNR